jgi:hypothetical protein
MKLPVLILHGTKDKAINQAVVSISMKQQDQRQNPEVI